MFKQTGSQSGMAAHVYLATRSMENEYFYNADAEMLFVPQQGGLRLRTEFGVYGTDTGRMCVAVLNSRNIDYVCQSIAAVL